MAARTGAASKACSSPPESFECARKNGTRGWKHSHHFSMENLAVFRGASSFLPCVTIVRKLINLGNLVEGQMVFVLSNRHGHRP
jgi:hypothetical protein